MHFAVYAFCMYGAFHTLFTFTIFFHFEIRIHVLQYILLNGAKKYQSVYWRTLNKKYSTVCFDFKPNVAQLEGKTMFANV